MEFYSIYHVKPKEIEVRYSTKFVVAMSLLAGSIIVGMVAGLLKTEQYRNSINILKIDAAHQNELSSIKSNYEMQMGLMREAFKAELTACTVEKDAVVRERDSLAVEVDQLKELVEAIHVDSKNKIVTYKIELSHYTASRDETDSTPNITATGSKPVVGRTLALSRDLFAHLKGKKVYIRGMGVFTVEDTMNPRYSRRGDLLVASKSEAFKLGVKKDVKIVVLPDI